MARKMRLNVGKKDEAARERIRLWLRGTGMTQVVLAEKIGRKQAWMSRYLDGEFDTDLDTLERLAHAFDHTLAELLDLTQDEAERALLDAVRALTPPKRALALQMVQAMAGSTPPVKKRGS